MATNFYLMLLINLSLIAIIGFIALGTVALKPRLFWPILIIATVGTGGIVIQSYGLADEYLTGCVLLGGFLAMSVGAIRLRKGRENIWDQFHRWIFLIMIVYMIIQSWRGLLLLESLRKIRWVAYYGMLGTLPFIISRRGFPVLSGRKISLIVVSTALGYFLLYIAIGLSYEIILGEPKWNIQNVQWGGTTYATFPLVIAMPALIFLIKDRSHIYRGIAWVTLIVMVLAGFYYKSRVSWLIILSFFIVSVPLLGFRNSVCYLLIFLLIPGVLFKTSKLFWAPSELVDVGRIIHLRIAFPIISLSDSTLLFGYGFRASGPLNLIGPNLARLWVEYGRPDIAQTVANYQSTVGFTTLLVETGLIGMLLLGTNFLFVAHKILVQTGSQRRSLLLLSLLMTFLWLFVTNPLDIVLFYLMIMPSGLLIQLSKYGVEEQVFEKRS